MPDHLYTTPHKNQVSAAARARRENRRIGDLFIREGKRICREEARRAMQGTRVKPLANTTARPKPPPPPIRRRQCYPPRAATSEDGGSDA